MKYENRTDLPDFIVRTIVEWVRERMNDDARRANILVQYKAHRKSFGGLARQMAWTGGRKTQGFPQGEPLVHIYVGPFWKQIKYPLSETYKKQAGALVYENFEEHLVSIVAHELRHIEQGGMEGGLEGAAKKLGHLEVDAERYARFMISEFRKSPPRLVAGMEAIAAKTPPKMKVCPRCQKEQEISTHFGYRKVKGNMIPQSYCHFCRRNHRKEM